jgi:hypothetical protein
MEKAADACSGVASTTCRGNGISANVFGGAGKRSANREGEIKRWSIGLGDCYDCFVQRLCTYAITVTTFLSGIAQGNERCLDGPCVEAAEGGRKF